jgi:DNA-binding protein HU-beta
MPKSSSSKAAKALPKTAVLSEIADKTELSKKQVESVLEALSSLAISQLKQRKPFTLPGLLKMSAKVSPARPARPGRNPATGEAMTIKARPARTVVRARPIKALKEAVL